MTLDLNKIAPQIGEMVNRLKAGNHDLQERLKCALDTLGDKNINLEKLKRKIAAGKGKTTWLVAGPADDLDARYPAPPVPEEYVAAGSDGSHIDFDRNKSARCFVINIGTVVLRYGNSPEALLDSVPHLYCTEDEMVIADENDKSNKRAIDSTLLGIKRGVEECRKLVDLAADIPQGSKSLFLVDGTLILWGLEAYPDYVAETLLKKEFLGCLDEMKIRGQPLASYISLPRSSEVVNALRVAICPQEIPDCDHCPEINGRHACDAVDGIQDYMLYSQMLGPGERSGLFFSQSQIVERLYGENRVYFFYLRVEDEIARVEIPEWVAMRRDLVDITHALVLDQCRKGQGYPVVLSEAHEKAVITGADREQFWELVEEFLIEGKMPTYTSTKSRSKRTRWI